MEVFIMNFFHNLYHLFDNLYFGGSSIGKMDKKAKYLCYTNCFFTIVILCLLFSIVIFFEHISFIFVAATGVIISCILLLFTLSNIYQCTQLQRTVDNLEQVSLYNTSLKTSHDDVRAFKHDFSNIVQSIGGYITSNDMEGLTIYYNQLFCDCQKLNTLYTLNPDAINDPAIFRLLSLKYYKAHELGIHMDLHIFLDLTELNMKIYEFSRVLGILVDNAIEAAAESKEKVINLELRRDIARNRQLLIIENTYSEKDIDMEHIFEKGFSSKPNNTGLGLWKVRQILKKSNNLNLHTTIEKRFFKQQLELYDIIKKEKVLSKSS